MSIEKNWEDALDILKNQLTDVAFNIYVKPLKPLYIEDKSFYLLTNETFYKTTIEHRYLNDIGKALRTCLGHEVNVLIVTEEDLKGENMNADTGEEKHTTNIIKKYKFDTFVKGKSNELAYTLAQAVANSPGKIYNPLFLYGGVGLGKTHLMHSIGNFVLDRDHEAKVLYCSTETFMNELINSIRHSKNQEFRNKYREIDILLIDDIQFLSDKEGTQEEFFHTFNTLYNANKQIVISSDKPPRELKTLEDRLRSRFGWGVIVDITLPDFETRTAILENKAELDNVSIPKDVIKFIAKNIVSNIRDLEGALNKVSVYATLSNSPITQNVAEIALKDIITQSEKPEITVEYIQKVVAAYFKITKEEILSKKRTQNIAFPRQVAMYLSRKLIDLSLPKIGELFGGRDHSTIIHGCDKITDLIESDSQIRNMVVEIEKELGK